MAGVARAFPLRDRHWSHYCWAEHLRGADDGEPGRGGWHFARSATHLHRGIDLKAEVGHEVVAVESGWVEFRCVRADPGSRGWNMAGHRIRLHGDSGAGYLYGHLGTTHAGTGDAFRAGARCGQLVGVRAGEIIGFVGHTGGAAAGGTLIPRRAAHLHFQYHPDGLDGADANPARLFERIARGQPLGEPRYPSRAGGAVR